MIIRIAEFLTPMCVFFSIKQLPLSQAYHLPVHYQMQTLDNPHDIQIVSLC